MLPVIRGPGKVPSASTAGRVKLSGAIFALTICKSVFGPMAAKVPIAKHSVTKVSKEVNFDIASGVEKLNG